MTRADKDKPVVLSRIYTRTGDDGMTTLSDLSRTSKTDPRLAAYADVEEANAHLGLAMSHGTLSAELVAVLVRVQNELFDLGADLATPDRGKELAWEPLRIVDSQVLRLEQEIDELNAEMEPLASFILRGGRPAAAQLHFACTVSRRAERIAVTLSRAEGEVVSEAALKYINRLSDLLFVAARFANAKGREDVLWQPGATR